MATNLKSMLQDSFPVPSAKGLRFAIVVTEWNSQVTNALLKGAVKQLVDAGVSEKTIIIKRVPGAYELTLAAQLLCEHTDVDAVIVLGCIIKGDTPHFDFIASGVTHGINSVTLEYNTPIAFGVLTTLDLNQAMERAGGALGNKGAEAAEAAIKMVLLKKDIEDNAE